jgi:hypothetical protein
MTEFSESPSANTGLKCIARIDHDSLDEPSNRGLQDPFRYVFQLFIEINHLLITLHFVVVRGGFASSQRVLGPSVVERQQLFLLQFPIEFLYKRLLAIAS